MLIMLCLLGELACLAAVKMRFWTEGMPEALSVALAKQRFFVSLLPLHITLRISELQQKALSFRDSPLNIIYLLKYTFD
jgi:hypothetical protein